MIWGVWRPWKGPWLSVIFGGSIDRYVPLREVAAIRGAIFRWMRGFKITSTGHFQEKIALLREKIVVFTSTVSGFDVFMFPNVISKDPPNPE